MAVIVQFWKVAWAGEPFPLRCTAPPPPTGAAFPENVLLRAVSFSVEAKKKMPPPPADEDAMLPEMVLSSIVTSASRE